MSTTATPYGMRPINMIGGRVNTGGFRQIKIASAYATDIFSGDLVKVVAAGTVERDASTDAAKPVGVFMGCTYTDPSLNYKLFNNMWPTGTVASDAFAYIVDDPDMTFLIQADGQVNQSEIGANFAMVHTAGSTAIGRSKIVLNATTGATTSTYPLRLIDFWDSPNSAINDAFTDCIVLINAHQHRLTLGIDT